MDWVRLWHDMPNDPKWRAISIKSGQSISLVISVYVHMMTVASQSEERGSIKGWSDEDIAAALDANSDAIEGIRDAMQGKVLDGDLMTGWDKRQPKKEDNSKERVRRFREKNLEKTESKKQEECNDGNAKCNDDANDVTRCNDDVTPGNAPDTDTDTDTDKKKNKKDSAAVAARFDRFWEAYPKKVEKKYAKQIFMRISPGEAMLDAMLTALADQRRQRIRDGSAKRFVPEWKNPSTWLNRACWTDETKPTPSADSPSRDDSSLPPGDWRLQPGFEGAI